LKAGICKRIRPPAPAVVTRPTWVPKIPVSLFFLQKWAGKSIYYRSETGTTDVKKVEHFGRGVLKIEKFKLADGKGGCPKIEWMAFTILLEGGY